MSELAAAVDASETLWTVDEVPDPAFGYYTVGSEIVQVVAGFPGGDPGYAVGQTFPSKIRVIRATNGTTAATHADGTALTAANAFSGGGDTRVTIDLSVAQIRLLDTVPVEVIPAPGAGKTLWLKEWLWQYTFGTVAYAAGLVQLRWVGSATYNVQVEQGFTLDSPVSRVGSEPLAAYYDDDVDAEDRALEVFAGNTPPGVSGDGTARLIVDYEIVTLA